MSDSRKLSSLCDLLILGSVLVPLALCGLGGILGDIDAQRRTDGRAR
jgi:hypothetical protein